MNEKYFGTAEMQKIESEKYKRQFDNFCAYKGKTLGQMMDRFWTLLGTMSGFGIVPTNAEMIDRFVVALPEEWSEILRNM